MDHPKVQNNISQSVNDLFGYLWDVVWVQRRWELTSKECHKGSEVDKSLDVISVLIRGGGVGDVTQVTNEHVRSRVLRDKFICWSPIGEH